MDEKGELLMSNPPFPHPPFKLNLPDLSAPPSQEASPLPKEDSPFGPAIPWPNSQSFPSSQGVSSQETVRSTISRQVSHLSSHESGGEITDAEQGSLDQLEDELPEEVVQGHPNRRRLSRLNPQTAAVPNDNIPLVE